jgi:hypothetical protein
LQHRKGTNSPKQKDQLYATSATSRIVGAVEIGPGLCDPDKKTPARRTAFYYFPRFKVRRQGQLGQLGRLGDDLAKLGGPCIEHLALPRHPGLKGKAVEVLGDRRPIVSVRVLARLMVEAERDIAVRQPKMLAQRRRRPAKIMRRERLHAEQFAKAESFLGAARRSEILEFRTRKLSGMILG